MKGLSKDIINFLNEQGFVIVLSIDKDGFPHASCKGIVKIDEYKLHLIDLYRAVTYNNIKQQPRISLVTVDEHQFKGYVIKGMARIIENEKIHDEVLEYWHRKLASRITARLLKNILGEKRISYHAEASLPEPKYLIEVNVEEIVDLTPRRLE